MILTARLTQTNLDLVLTSNPVAFLDGRLFFKYYDRDNRSDDAEDNLSWIDRSFGTSLCLNFLPVFV